MIVKDIYNAPNMDVISTVTTERKVKFLIAKYCCHMIW